MNAGSLRHPGNWPLAARAACALAVARILLAAAPGWTLAKMRQTPVRRGDNPDVDRIAGAVWTIAGRTRDVSCLPRSLAITALARRAGAPAHLVIGVRRDGGSMAAHAWVEHGGRAVPHQDVREYERLWESA